MTALSVVPAGIDHAGMAGQIKRPFRLTATQPTESSEGAALIRWRDYAQRQFPELASLYHIPNGGARAPQVGAQLKREGVLRGMPDYCLPVANGGFNALYIELKRRDGGILSDSQQATHERLRALGNRVIVAAGWEAARDSILHYLNLKNG